MQNYKRGAFIVFEGLDRSGKSTQTNLLLNYLKLKNIKAVQMRFPDRTTRSGKIINDYLTNKIELSDKEIHKLFADNRKEKINTIKELLYDGTTIICDRYAFSGVAFSAAKGLDIDWCKDADRGIPQPDLVIYLKLSLESSKDRDDYGKERYENLEMQSNVKRIYENDLYDEMYWKSVDAERSITDVEMEIRKHIMDLFSSDKLNEEIKELWKQ